MLDGCQLDSILGDWKVDPAEDDNPFTLVSVQKMWNITFFPMKKMLCSTFFPMKKMSS